MNKLWNALTRRKRNDSDGEESKLARVLNLVDLTALGVGSTLGLGVYILAGSVAYEQAGPAVTISFAIAAIASAIAGFCYAEFAARVPKAGSAYVYSYVSVGEFVAFTIGWNLILEYVIGTSSVARGMSGYIDALINNTMSRSLKESMPINVNFLADYPDFFSFFIVLVISTLLAFGVKESTLMNNIFTGVNLIVISIVLVAGIINADIKNWQIQKEDIPEGISAGEGGFMPYGVAGIMAGAAKCFYGFVGFDCVATTGEEAKNPQKNIPLAIVISLIIIFLAYFGISAVLTLMWPYYLQDPEAPFPHVFNEIGWHEVKWIVSIGAIFALCTSLLGAMFPLPRVLYAMSNDGILYKTLKRVNSKTQTPVIATLLSGLLAAIMALMFNLNQLIDMMSIGTLLAYTIVAICVLVLRYQDDGLIIGKEVEIGTPRILKQIFNLNFIKKPDSLSSSISKLGIVVYSLLCIVLCALLLSPTMITPEYPFYLTVTVVVVATMILVICVLARQPASDVKLSFKVPMVPLLPSLSIFINLYLMFQLDLNTWIRFGAWVIIGYIIYFTYGIRHSTEGNLRSAESRRDSTFDKKKAPVMPIEPNFMKDRYVIKS
ncbi:cationic amino acid transporter 3 [Culicoides brevitarsis]|uniref:cationic amino acid transporter 3 n=1 Tax=Culicoides brevitarsis TaxID=469753 RepID=UPI00307C47D5